MVKSESKDKQGGANKKPTVADRLTVDPPRETARSEMVRLRQQIKKDKQASGKCP